MSELAFDPTTVALILIDLQNGLAGRPLAPHTFDQVIERSRTVAAALRTAGSTIVYVRVDINDMITKLTDEPSRMPKDGSIPASFSELVPTSGFEDGDLLITKRSWGAFYGTPLEEQLQQRGITTLIMGGVATNFGVESTARAASDLGYQIILVEDLMSTVSKEAHDFAVSLIFPRLGLVRQSADVLKALAQ